MKTKFLTVLAVVAVVVAMTSVAKADTFTCSNAGDLTLEQSLSGGGSAMACLNVTGSTATLEDLFLNGNAITGAKVFTIAWMGTTTLTSANDGNTWSPANNLPANADGWGSYDQVWTASSVSTDNYTGDGSLVWTFSGNPGTDFALHIGGFATTNCSVWVSTRWSSENQNTNDSDCGGGTTVPEPGSLMLFGTGLLGMAGFMKRKLLG